METIFYLITFIMGIIFFFMKITYPKNGFIEVIIKGFVKIALAFVFLYSGAKLLIIWELINK